MSEMTITRLRFQRSTQAPTKGENSSTGSSWAMPSSQSRREDSRGAREVAGVLEQEPVERDHGQALARDGDELAADQREEVTLPQQRARRCFLGHDA